MPIDFSNTNLAWTSILAETLHRLGLVTAVICPGSRSAPLAIAFANHPNIEAIPVLDERSAAFFALGIAQQTRRPVVLVCTSGTAGANFYPAVIEARESRVPLLILTADRPPELRDCNAGQAIDQHKLYGSFPNWHTELALPSLDMSLLAYLRQTMVHAWERTLYPVSGPVHLNLPFREPLAPIPQSEALTFKTTFNEEDFFSSVLPIAAVPHSFISATLPISELTSDRGVIVVGPVKPHSPAAFSRAIAQLSEKLSYPVLAEGLSPLRNYADLNPNLISTYDLLLRNTSLAEKLAPDVVLRIGEMPTSKQLRTWLERNQPRQWIIDPDGRNLDPLHGKTIHLRVTVEALTAVAPAYENGSNSYLKFWRATETQVRQRLDQTMREIDWLFEGKTAWLLSKTLPSGTALFVSSSMPVRDVEFFWTTGNSAINPFFNRGANGIDGSLSTALGMAHHRQSCVMITGDLALLHDTNGFLLRQQFVGHLTIVLINNNGGGIFEMLPIAQFDPPFETFFATPQSVSFAQLCAAYGVEHKFIKSWDELTQQLNPLPKTGIRVLEIQTDRKADALWRHNNLGTFAADITTGEEIRN